MIFDIYYKEGVELWWVEWGWVHQRLDQKRSLWKKSKGSNYSLSQGGNTHAHVKNKYGHQIKYNMDACRMKNIVMKKIQDVSMSNIDNIHEHTFCVCMSLYIIA